MIVRRIVFSGWFVYGIIAGLIVCALTNFIWPAVIVVSLYLAFCLTMAVSKRARYAFVDWLDRTDGKS